MRQIGKKGRAWIKNRAELIKRALLENRIVIYNGSVMGACEDCKKWRVLDPDHRKKRTQGGSDEYENIDWVCRECHGERDNMGDPKNKKIKKSKAGWQMEHNCVSCKHITRQLICDSCGKLSIK